MYVCTHNLRTVSFYFAFDAAVRSFLLFDCEIICIFLECFCLSYLLAVLMLFLSGACFLSDLLSFVLSCKGKCECKVKVRNDTHYNSILLL